MAGRSLVIAVAAAAALAGIQCGCGSSSPQFPSLGTGSASATVSVDSWDQCLRNHGVSVPAGYDPYNVPAGSKKLNASDSVVNAFAVHLPPAPPLTNSERQQWLAFVACMRAHGFDAPDPSFLPDGNVEITFPVGVGPNLPGFTAAQNACNTQAGFGTSGSSPSPTGG